MAVTSPPAYAVNLLPRTDGEARQMAEVVGGLWYAGVVVKDLTDDAAVARVRAWQDLGYRVSVGMGDGDEGQWRRALDVAAKTAPAHLNQPWFAAGIAAETLRARGVDTLVNAMVSPAEPGYGSVRLAPGADPVTLPLPLLAEGLANWGAWSVKFFPLRGSQGRAAYAALVRALAAAHGPKVVEPSGGVHPEDLPWLFEEAAGAGLGAVPHVYGAVRTEGGALSTTALGRIRRALAEAGALSSRASGWAGVGTVTS